mmetsp:Transcript_106750/g.283998  ORF Transcript_106750/g.283998 Transcript_106750/m.283998 type:complete len:524 (-) Transcript_106750:327-1898(-)
MLQGAPQIALAYRIELHDQLRPTALCRHLQPPVAAVAPVAGAEDAAAAVSGREEPLVPVPVADHLELHGAPRGHGHLRAVHRVPGRVPRKVLEAPPVAPAAHQRVAPRERHGLLLRLGTRRRPGPAGAKHVAGQRVTHEAARRRLGGGAPELTACSREGIPPNGPGLALAELKEADAGLHLLQQLVRVGLWPEALWGHVHAVGALALGRRAAVPARDVGLELRLLGVELPADVALVRAHAPGGRDVDVQVRARVTERSQGPRDRAARSVVRHEEGRGDLVEQQREDVALAHLPAAGPEPRHALLDVLNEGGHAAEVAELLVRAEHAVEQLDDAAGRRRVLGALDLEGLREVAAGLLPALQADHAVRDGARGPARQRLQRPEGPGLELVGLAQGGLRPGVPGLRGPVLAREVVRVADAHGDLADVGEDLREHDPVAGLGGAVDLGGLAAEVVGHAHLLALVRLLPQAGVALAQVPDVEPGSGYATLALHLDALPRVLEAALRLIQGGVAPGQIAVEDVVELPAL